MGDPIDLNYLAVILVDIKLLIAHNAGNVHTIHYTRTNVPLSAPLSPASSAKVRPKPLTLLHLDQVVKHIVNRRNDLSVRLEGPFGDDHIRQLRAQVDV